MIRFACPACKAALSVPDGTAGKKGTCPQCQQRLEVPKPPPPSTNKTVLGQLLDESSPAVVAPIVPPLAIPVAASPAPMAIPVLETPQDAGKRGRPASHHDEAVASELHDDLRQDRKKKPEWSTVRVTVVLGALLFIFGLFGTLRYLSMDTTVEVPSIGLRVHNIGLMDERRNGLLVSISATALGIVLVIVGNKR